eukprot:CAMPEP_0113386702 /NCGR_PEP_ID=MMETSP0013_2-20120614/8151_1 /TAXON_ID=2843 ORGANISM="Skeletonema costatum, Strain 1716" /NCGR_SAMPLE_ID=MMETSP0013_2 /ASSEMBLY_ACC=CAM_ASM_000158 /LENGTH=383 /DNA_ID=CAMNT_0000269563 /DNA_START=5 /DNA_END=1156 /DNA_ORIENTATION=+ /assembly_acc=CAM_ASM_000158
MTSMKTTAALLALYAAVEPSAAFMTGPVRTSSATSTSLQQTKDNYEFQRKLLETQFAISGAVTVEDHIEEQEESSTPSIDATAFQIFLDEHEQPSAPIDATAIQNSILRVAASTDRGQYASAAQKESVASLVESLESNKPKQTDTFSSSATLPSYLAGTWELTYSTNQLFRSSPFFLAGRSTCKTQAEVDQYNWFCEMHRAALAISTIGVVRQVISRDGKLTNEFEVKVGAVPFVSDFLPFVKYSGGLPLTVDGAIVSTADATPMSMENKDDWQLYMDTVEIKGSNIPILRNLLDGDNSKLKSRDLSKLLEDNVDAYEVPRPVLRTTYVDSALRIVRDEDDNIFIYSRVSDSEEVTDYSNVMADLGVASLLEGFNDAVSKIYL